MTSSLPALPSYGVVVIGRNEGERLRQCLQSLDPRRAPLVYVDSGSTDGSVAMAQQMGATVVALDMSRPFTAARARNEGFAQLMALAPATGLVQFVDGDCEVDRDWIDLARGFLQQRPEVVAVSGRRRERYPDRSIYNAMCEMDWHGREGRSRSFGGDVMLRAPALQAVTGYNPALIAGEEPELSIRLRQQGWQIWHLESPMTLHDANILRLSQWWRRTIRTGYAFAEGSAMYGAPPERHWVREARSAWLWGLMLPLASMLTVLLFGAWGLLPLLLYPLQVIRLFFRMPFPTRWSAIRAGLLVLGKFPEAWGVLKFRRARLRGETTRLIEYK